MSTSNLHVLRGNRAPSHLNSYIAVHQEVELFEAAFEQQLPVMLKGPTGVGKTRFVEHMAERLDVPLITVSCHAGLTASDLVGRYIQQGDETLWIDGPLTRAVRDGAILYLDEAAEARADNLVVLHPLMDHRRELHIERLGETMRAQPNFMLVMSSTSGTGTSIPAMKVSTRQRMISVDFDFPPSHIERQVLVSLYGINAKLADQLVQLAHAIRGLAEPTLGEAASTRAIVSAGRLTKAGSWMVPQVAPPRVAAAR